MTVLGIPVINRPDLLARLLDSIDVPCEVIVIDNSADESIGDVCAGRDVTLIRTGHNLGVAASWNLLPRIRPHEPGWLLANADTVLGPGDIARIGRELAKGGARWVGMNGDWRIFGWSAECVERVGFFDENLHPCYLEDCDYERRCTLAGVPWYTIPGLADHAGSAAIRSDPALAARNAATYPANLAYYVAKWGGGHRGGERYATPFDRGGSVADWTLDLSRLRTNDWHRRDGDPSALE